MSDESIALWQIYNTLSVWKQNTEIWFDVYTSIGVSKYKLDDSSEKKDEKTIRKSLSVGLHNGTVKGYLNINCDGLCMTLHIHHLL